MRILSGFRLVAGDACRRMLFHRRTLGLLLLFAFPVLFAYLTVTFNPHPGINHFFFTILWVVLQTALPIAALVAGVAVLDDEIEGRTITYLYTRPLPRPLFYLGRLSGHFAACAVILSASLLLTFLLFSGPLDFTAVEIVATLGITWLGLATYTAFFSLLRIFFKRALFVGFLITFVFEGWVSKLPVSGFARASIWHHLALLEIRLLEPRGEPLKIPSSFAAQETAGDSLLWLAIILAVCLLLGAWLVRTREIRLPAAVA